MTTTAHEDQFTVAPEPVRQPYSTADILRRNVVDLEIALKQQTERAEKAEAELARLREQKAALYMAFSDCGNFIRYWTRDTKNLEATMAVNDFEVLEFYAAPVPASAVPEDWRNIVTEILSLRERTEIAESELEKLRQQEPVLVMCGGYEWRTVAEAEHFCRVNHASHPIRIFYSRPIPGPSVPAEWRHFIEVTAASGLHQTLSGADCSCDRCRAIRGARALLQSPAVKDSLTTQADCRACVNRGRVNGLSQETYCESCVHEGRNWRKNHFLDAAADRLLEKNRE